MSRVELLDAPLPDGVRGGFTTRRGGTSLPPYDQANLSVHVGDDGDRVLANRELLARAVGVAPGALAFVRQVHRDGVRVVDAVSTELADGGAADCDALVTAVPGIALVVLAADCLPVLLADPVAGVVGAAHAGRPGLVAGVLPRTVEAMVAAGADPGRTTAVVGPAAGACCYEVPADMAAAVEHAVPGTRSSTRRGTPSVDLRAGAEAVLRRCGVADVAHLAACTIDDDRFFSYRREGRTGRHGGVVVLTAEGVR